MPFIRSHVPINAHSGQGKYERVRFNWDIPPATFISKNGISETDGKHMGILPELDPGQSLSHISGSSNAEAQLGSIWGTGPKVYNEDQRHVLFYQV